MAMLALLWGSAFLWIKLALNNGLTPVQITVARSALGALVLLALARAARQRLPRDRGTWARLTVAAFFCNALPFFLFGTGEQSVDSGVAGVLNATTPLWSLLIGWAVGTERGLSPVRLAGLLLGFAGTFYLSYRLIADEGATSAATVGYLLPVVSVALGAIVLDEALGPRVLAGMVVVLVGVAMTRHTTRRPAPTT